MAWHASDVRRRGYAINSCEDHSACAASRSAANTGRATCCASIGAGVDVDVINRTSASRAARREREGFVGGRASASEHHSHLTESHSSGFQGSERKTTRPNCAQDSACRYTTQGAGDHGGKFIAHGG
jgi:hypothetical protein